MKRHLKRIIIGAIILAVLATVYLFTDGFKGKEDAVENDFTAVRLVRVVDGDTIVVKLDEEEIKVRFIGVDAPESVHSDESENTPEGELAAEYLKSIVKAEDTLYLQYDEERIDVYGRTLAYVWMEDKVDITNEADAVKYMLNAIMVKAGFAEPYEYPPNTRYQNVFKGLAE